MGKEHEVLNRSGEGERGAA